MDLITLINLLQETLETNGNMGVFKSGMRPMQEDDFALEENEETGKKYFLIGGC